MGKKKVYWLGGNLSYHETEQYYEKKYGLVVNETFKDFKRTQEDFDLISIPHCNRKKFKEIWTSDDTYAIFLLSHGTKSGVPWAFGSIDNLLNPIDEKFPMSGKNLRSLTLWSCYSHSYEKEWKEKIQFKTPSVRTVSYELAGLRTGRDDVLRWADEKTDDRKPEYGLKFQLQYAAGTYQGDDESETYPNQMISHDYFEPDHLFVPVRIIPFEEPAQEGSIEIGPVKLLRLFEHLDLEEQPQVPQQTQASVIPDLSDRIRIVDFDEQPQVPQQPQASVIPNLSERIRIVDNDITVEFGEGLVGIPHKIRYGDRVWYLADDYGYTDRKQFVEDVRALNPGIDFNNLKPRDEIFVPTNVENPKLSTPYGLRRDQQASTMPGSSERTNLSEMIKVSQGPGEIDEGPQVPLQHRQASTIPGSSERTNLSEMIKVLQRPDEIEEGPQIPSQSQASVIPDLSDGILESRLPRPLQSQASVIPDLSDGILESRLPGPPQWMDQGVGPQVDLRPPSGPPQSPWAQWGLG